MVNSKKMSRSTVAVVLLSLLLVLSLVLTATGAWFTDWLNPTHNEPLDFGLVDITADEAAIQAASPASFTHALPGDIFNLSGSVTSNSTVDTYVLLVVDTALRIEDAEAEGGYAEKSVYYWDATAAEGVGAYVLAINVGSLESTTLVGSWSAAVEVDGIDDANLATTGLMYLVPADQASETHSFTSTLEIDVLTPNYVLLVEKVAGEEVPGTIAGPRTFDDEVLLNGAEGYDIQVRFSVRAVQERYHDAESAWEFLHLASNFAGPEKQYPDA